jgi:hypothetical protein
MTVWRLERKKERQIRPVEFLYALGLVVQATVVEMEGYLLVPRWYLPLPLPGLGATSNAAGNCLFGHGRYPLALIVKVCWYEGIKWTLETAAGRYFPSKIGQNQVPETKPTTLAKIERSSRQSCLEHE